MYTVEFHPFFCEESPFLLSTGNDGICKIWKVDVQRDSDENVSVNDVSSMSFHCKSIARDQIRCVAFSLGGTVFLVGGTDGLLRVFMTPDPNSPSFLPVVDPVHNNNTQLSTDDSNEDIIIDSDVSTPIRASTSADVVNSDNIASGPIRSDSPLVNRGRLGQRRRTSAANAAQITSKNNIVTSTTSPIKDQMAINGESHLLQIFDDHSGYVTCLFCSNDGRLVSGSWDGTTRIRTYSKYTCKWTSIIRMYTHFSGDIYR